MMRVCVLGAGLLGLTSAYFLHRAGCQVLVLERCEGPGLETSFANGGLLTSSMADPWNAPGSWKVLAASLLDAESPLKLRLSAIPSLSVWGLDFLRHATAAHYAYATSVNLKLARYSLECLSALEREAGLDFAHSALGSLRVFRAEAALAAQSRAAEQLAALGLRHTRLTPQQALRLEPALMAIAPSLVGAIHYPDDQVGDAQRFCAGIADHLQSLGVPVHYRSVVNSFERSGHKLGAALTKTARHAADAFVLAAGSWSSRLARRLGVSLPIRPAKGYSVTLPQANPEAGLRIPVVDDDLHAVLTPLGNAVRAAGTAEFAGYDTRLDPARIRNLIAFAERTLPQAQFDVSAATPWCGLRPMSADGVPRIGRTALSNLWVNTGHGHLGWTMAAGAGRLLADLMTQKTPGIDPGPYALEHV